MNRYLPLLLFLVALSPVVVAQTMSPPAGEKSSFVKQLKEKAEAGDLWSQLELGKLLYFQNAIARNQGLGSLEEEVWLKKAATQGSAEAQYYLGELYLDKGVYWLGTGDKAYQVRPNAKLAVEYFEKAAKQDFTSAIASLSLCYEFGWGVEKNFQKRFELLMTIANRGREGVQWIVGEKYEKGEGIPRNYQSAVKWYFRAASQGLVPAQYDLARMFYNGRGTARDLVAAYFWTLLATGKQPQFSKAIELRDSVESQLSAAQIADAQERAASWVAVKEVEY